MQGMRNKSRGAISLHPTALRTKCVGNSSLAVRDVKFDTSTFGDKTELKVSQS